MSTIGQVRRMLRIQALEAAKREDYRTRTHFPKKEEETPAEVETQVTE